MDDFVSTLCFCLCLCLCLSLSLSLSVSLSLSLSQFFQTTTHLVRHSKQLEKLDLLLLAENFIKFTLSTIVYVINVSPWKVVLLSLDYASLTTHTPPTFNYCVSRPFIDLYSNPQ